ncbi:hypothetical protein NT239_02080 [Chitinibacter sp. SCUT-21]|uniref:hypothetical protein n=1 Tax=Chitinibacter sp. SCUT-21 TaxID=2970891 RepID=UPI0035A627AA
MLKAITIMLLISIPLDQTQAADLILSIDRTIDRQDTPRYGLNLGGPSYWGAEQLRANIVRNPSYMPMLDRSIVFVDTVAGRKISDKDAWASRADGFWTGASYSVLSGAMAGTQGRVYDYRRQAPASGQFWLDKELTALQVGDAISVIKTSNSQNIAQWWTTGRTSLLLQNGNGIARLQPNSNQAAQLASYFDTLGGESGRLLPIHGEWQLRFKVRSARAGAKLNIRFARDKQAAFVQESVVPSEQWQSIEFNWQGKEGPSSESAPLSLSFTAEGDGEIWLDEVYLGEKDPLPGGFRRVVVDTLKTLKPGILRDWQGQLGDSSANRFANAWQRQPIRYRPGDNESFFAYSIQDLFDLCAQIKATPWVIGPTTLSSSEWFQFGQQLSALATQKHINEVLVEFGNENWNALFRPAGFTNVKQHQLVADAAFAALKRGFYQNKPNSKLITLVNAPFLWPDSPGAIVNSQQADRVAVAPYFLYQINNNESEKTLRQRALASQLSLLTKQQLHAQSQAKRLATYEINFHSTLGTAQADLRKTVLNNGIAGVALARQLIDSSLAGLREQAVYSLAGYSFKLEKGLGDIPLFGITRDLSQANRLRPTGWGLALLNEVAGGPISALRCNGEREQCQQISAVMYGQGQNARFALVNASEQAHRLQLPCQGPLKWAILNGSHTGNHELSAASFISRGKANCQQGMVRISLSGQSLLTATQER